jgi:hypothetical protein
MRHVDVLVGIGRSVAHGHVCGSVRRRRRQQMRLLRRRLVHGGGLLSLTAGRQQPVRRRRLRHGVGDHEASVVPEDTLANGYATQTRERNNATKLNTIGHSCRWAHATDTKTVQKHGRHRPPTYPDPNMQSARIASALVQLRTNGPHRPPQSDTIALATVTGAARRRITSHHQRKKHSHTVH